MSSSDHGASQQQRASETQSLPRTQRSSRPGISALSERDGSRRTAASSSPFHNGKLVYFLFEVLCTCF